MSEGKRFRSRIAVGTDHAGNMIYKWASGHTEEELEENRKKLLQRYVNGQEIDRDILYSAYLAQWFYRYAIQAASTRTGRPLSDSMVFNLRNAINRYIGPAFWDRRMRAITIFDLEEFMGSLRGKNKTVIGDCYRIIRDTFALAYAQGILDRNPAVALKKSAPAKKKKRRELTTSETRATLAYMEAHPEDLLMPLLYYTGMRRGEAVALKWRDIDLDAGIIHISHNLDLRTGKLGDTKSEAGVRVVPIPAQLRNALLPYQGIADALVVPAPEGGFMNSHSFTRRWNRVRVELYALAPDIQTEEIRNPYLGAGYRSDLHKDEVFVGSVLTPHFYRHNYATLLYWAGVDLLTAQSYLGHSDAGTTLQIYTHMSKVAMAKKPPQDMEKVFSSAKQLTVEL